MSKTAKISWLIKSSVVTGLVAGAVFALGPKASAQGLVRLFADSPQTSSILATAEANPVRLIVALKTRQSFSSLRGDLSTLMSAVAEARGRTEQSLSWLANQVSRRYEFIPAVSLTANRAQIEDLLRSGQVAAVYEEQPYEFLLDDSGPIIGKPGARALKATGAGQVIAVLDTGFDVDHPFLAGKIVAEACFSLNGTAQNPSEKGFSNCPGATAQEYGPGSSRFNAAPGYFGTFHGTHVAGIAAGKGGNFSGVAPEAKLMLANIFYRRDRSKCPKNLDKRYAGCLKAMPSSILSAFEWIFKQRGDFKIAAVNASWGVGAEKAPCGQDNPMAQAFNLVRAADIAVVAAAGNAGLKDSVGIPACLPSAISVGASTNQDQVANFSNSASFLDVLAPGVDILSSLPGGKFISYSGTSMATPQVSGAIAALRSVRPTATVDEVLKALVETGVPIRDSNGLVKPRIQIDKAVAALKAGDTATKVTPPSTEAVTVIDGIKVRKSPGAVRKKPRNKAINPDGSIKW